jgi:hypothetical protein
MTDHAVSFFGAFVKAYIPVLSTQVSLMLLCLLSALDFILVALNCFWHGPHSTGALAVTLYSYRHRIEMLVSHTWPKADLLCASVACLDVCHSHLVLNQWH